MSRTILLADDSVTIQKVIELTFMDEDYEVVAVGNGDDALEQLDEITPDFVIADVHMPGANGYDVAKHSKSLRPEVPVLLLVGTFEPFDEEQAEKSGCDAYLKKPFDSQELQRLVEELSAEAARDAGPLEATGWRAESPLVSGAAAAVGEDATASEDATAGATGDEEPEATPFSIGLEDDDEPAPTRVEPPAETRAESPSWTAPGVAESTAATDEEPVFDLGDSEQQEAPGATQAAPEVAAEAAAEPPAPEPELPPEAAPVESAPPEPVRSYTPLVETVEATPEDERPTGPLSDEDVDRIARRIVELLGDRAIRDVAWEVVPDLAEVVIRGRLRELESQVESVE